MPVLKRYHSASRGMKASVCVKTLVKVRALAWDLSLSLPLSLSHSVLSTSDKCEWSGRERTREGIQRGGEGEGWAIIHTGFSCPDGTNTESRTLSACVGVGGMICCLSGAALKRAPPRLARAHKVILGVAPTRSNLQEHKSTMLSLLLTHHADS